ncbi:uncharacterized protein LOC131041412 isoform X2 [Cryptomeria japonica]|uniref:uncharacterized protein LOC131041412 isoform X2 n=1 Tax=Cryptomeria japonica TaxID=3369 RepID=UPI0025AB9988|nr:uncharacterized protein LOC131041412 isoform X2 [Cryptomeria japonica]
MAFVVTAVQLPSLKTIHVYEEAYKFGGRNGMIKPSRKRMRRYSRCLSGGEEEEGHNRFEDNSVTDSQVGTKIMPDVWKGATEFSNFRGGTRAGLFRTPSSGGVQSATGAHDLPHPAVAVRNLMEQAHYGHLCTIMSEMHHRRRGYPFGSLIDFVPDDHGHPIFCFSPLGIHTRNVLADARCTLMVQIPGWTGLANARVTLFGDVYSMPAEKQEWARKYFSSKHPQETCQQWGNFSYYRMAKISDIYFMGGFGTVAWVDVNQYISAQPDSIVVSGFKQSLKVQGIDCTWFCKFEQCPFPQLWLTRDSTLAKVSLSQNLTFLNKNNFLAV